MLNVPFWHKADIHTESTGGGNRIVAYNPYHRLIYIFSIFDVPANVPANTLDAIGLLWTRLSAFGTKQTFNPDYQEIFS